MASPERRRRLRLIKLVKEQPLISFSNLNFDRLSLTLSPSPNQDSRDFLVSGSEAGKPRLSKYGLTE